MKKKNSNYEKPIDTRFINFGSQDNNLPPSIVQTFMGSDLYAMMHPEAENNPLVRKKTFSEADEMGSNKYNKWFNKGMNFNSNSLGFKLKYLFTPGKAKRNEMAEAAFANQEAKTVGTEAYKPYNLIKENNAEILEGKKLAFDANKEVLANVNKHKEELKNIPLNPEIDPEEVRNLDSKLQMIVTDTKLDVNKLKAAKQLNQSADSIGDSLYKEELENERNKNKKFNYYTKEQKFKEQLEAERNSAIGNEVSMLAESVQIAGKKFKQGKANRNHAALEHAR